MDKDATKFFEANNKAAGTRARKHLQQLKTLAQVRHAVLVFSVTVEGGVGARCEEGLFQARLVSLLGLMCKLTIMCPLDYVFVVHRATVFDSPCLFDWFRSCGFSFRAPRTRSKRSSTSRVATRTRALLRTHTWAPVICSNTPILETTKVAISRVFMCFSLCRCPSCRLNRHVWHLQVIGRCCSAWAIS